MRLDNIPKAALQAELKRRELEAEKTKYSKAEAAVISQRIAEYYGRPEALWEITTEGDCEGRTINSLGIEYGNIFDLARKYSGHCMYSLRFERAKSVVKNPETKEVHVSLGIDSGTWKDPAVLLPDIFREWMMFNPPDCVASIEPSTGGGTGSVKVVFK